MLTEPVLTKEPRLSGISMSVLLLSKSHSRATRMSQSIRRRRMHQSRTDLNFSIWTTRARTIPKKKSSITAEFLCPAMLLLAQADCADNPCALCLSSTVNRLLSQGLWLCFFAGYSFSRYCFHRSRKCRHWRSGAFLSPGPWW